ncbi:MAG: hypothetical protein ABI640_09415 [Gammaproteobacteria bacterium]
MSFREKSAWISFTCLLLQIVLHPIVVVQASKDARTPKDEGERLIELRAARVGFHAHGQSVTLLASVGFAVLIARLMQLGTEVTIYGRGG